MSGNPARKKAPATLDPGTFGSSQAAINLVARLNKSYSYDSKVRRYVSEAIHFATSGIKQANTIQDLRFRRYFLSLHREAVLKNMARGKVYNNCIDEETFTHAVNVIVTYFKIAVRNNE